MIEFNINQTVKVKLTEAGIRELQKQRQELNDGLLKLNLVSGLGGYVHEPDEDGYTSFQMWHLMQHLGHLCQLGCEPPFETEILLDIKS